MERRLSKTQIYEGGGPFARTVERGEPPKMLRDRLYDRMCDWKGHTIAELESWLPGNRWVMAMLELIAFGFAFDREVLPDGRKVLLLRKREPYEIRQLVVEILSGMTLPDRIVVVPEPFVTAATPIERSSSEDVLVEENQWTPPPDVERMVIDKAGDIVLSVPDLVSDTIGILARKGAGKTYLAMVLAEEFLASSFDIPFVVLDPTGVWWGLLADVAGKPSTNKLVLFGGAHGHYPLDSHDGAIMAKVVVACRPLPAIFDLSAFAREEQHRFVADFAAELFLANKDPLHIFMDEADGFAPQKLDKSSRHQKRSLAEIDCLVRRGRVHGLGVTLITQRPAVISKDVLSQVGAMFFLQTGAPHDLKAIETWLHKAIRRDDRVRCLDELQVLGQGETFYMRSGAQYRFCKFTVRPKSTFDSSYTPRIGDKPRSFELLQLDDEDRSKVEEVLAAVRSGESVPGESISSDGDDEGDDNRESDADIVNQASAAVMSETGTDGEDSETESVEATDELAPENNTTVDLGDEPDDEYPITDEHVGFDDGDEDDGDGDSELAPDDSGMKDR